MNKKTTLVCIIILFIAEFLPAQDIIVLDNGELIKSKVMEIQLTKIRYKRFDQQNGPIYSLQKSKVFAIHYEDGTKDIYGKDEKAIANVNQSIEELIQDTAEAKENEDTFMKKKVIIHASIGLQKVYSPVNEIGVDGYQLQSLYWQADVAMGLNTNLAVGFSYGQGKYYAEKTYTDQFQFTNTTFEISQNISSFTVFGRYYLKTKYPRFRPYATLGLSLNSSAVDVTITTVTEEQTINFSRGGRIMDVFPLTKVGMEIDVSDYIGLFTEIGYGITLINLGLQYTF